MEPGFTWHARLLPSCSPLFPRFTRDFAGLRVCILTSFLAVALARLQPLPRIKREAVMGVHRPRKAGRLWDHGVPRVENRLMKWSVILYTVTEFLFLFFSVMPSPGGKSQGQALRGTENKPGCDRVDTWALQYIPPPQPYYWLHTQGRRAELRNNAR